MFNKSLVVLIASFLFIGCDPRHDEKVIMQIQKLDVTTQAATLQQCANGGTQVNVGDSVTLVCNGNVGATGSQGIQGNAGAVGANGAVGATGAQGHVGATGAQGSQGVAGPQGPAGPSGSNGTTVSVVNLCPGVTSYPGVFVEVALCIAGNLYAVYSAEDGFLTYLPSGSYSSHAIGSSCNLTVSAGCKVTH